MRSPMRCRRVADELDVAHGPDLVQHVGAVRGRVQQVRLRSAVDHVRVKSELDEFLAVEGCLDTTPSMVWRLQA